MYDLHEWCILSDGNIVVHIVVVSWGCANCHNVPTGHWRYK